MRKLLLLPVLSFVMCAVPHAAAEPPPIVPKICHGYLPYPETPVWGAPVNSCPASHAIMGIYGINGPREGPPERIAVAENCCPLPTDDILTDTVVEVPDICPDGYVVTGALSYVRAKMPEIKEQRIFPLRCTKVNLKRYSLSKPTTGAYYGFGTNYWKQGRSIFTTDIPAGLRYGIGRRSRYRWNIQGCIGYPFGSLLIGRFGKRCQDLLFRQLLYRGIPGDPPEGTPVPVFPKCRYVSDIYSPTPVCETE